MVSMMVSGTSGDRGPMRPIELLIDLDVEGLDDGRVALEVSLDRLRQLR